MEILDYARALQADGIEAADLPEILGERLLGIGSKRCALLASGRVAKIAWREKGTWDNRAEAALWQWAPPDLRRLLAPCLFFEEEVLWQERCWPLSQGAKTREVGAELARWGISDSAVNLGLFEGRIVCYDYAFFAPWVFEEIAPLIAKNEQKKTFAIE